MKKKYKPHYIRRLTLIIWAFIAIGPFIPLIIISFAWRWSWPDILPSEWWIMERKNNLAPSGWDYIFSPTSRLLEATINSLIIGFGVMILSLAICLPAARFFTRNQTKTKLMLEFFLATPLLVPEIAMAFGLVMVFSYFNLDGYIITIIFAQLVPVVPYMLRTLSAVYQALPESYEQQAQTLGANKIQRFWFVTFPMLSSGIAAGCLFAFLVSLNIFLLTFMISQGKIITLPTLLFSALSGGGTISPVAAGITLMTTLPGIILLIFLDKYIHDDMVGANMRN